MTGQPTRRAMAVFYAICFGISVALCAVGFVFSIATALVQP